MTKLKVDLDVSYIYPYTYNKNYRGCTTIFKDPPAGFVRELVKQNNILKIT